MLKYRGQYRVLYELDKQGKPTEFSYIPCNIKKGTNICRHSDNTLNTYITSTKIASRLLKEYPEIFKPFQIGEGEGTLIFKESSIEKVAVILKARTFVKNMSPKPKRKHIISEEEKQRLTERLLALKHK